MWQLRGVGPKGCAVGSDQPTRARLPIPDLGSLEKSTQELSLKLLDSREYELGIEHLRVKGHAHIAVRPHGFRLPLDVRGAGQRVGKHGARRLTVEIDLHAPRASAV